MKTAKRLIAALLVATAFAALAGPASAREYVVYSCKLPDGRPAPTDGWSANGSAPYSWWDNGCPAGGSLSAGLRGIAQPANASNIGWGFDSGAAPIRSYKIQRTGRVSGWTPGVSMLLFSADSKNIPGNGNVVDYCAAFAGCSGTSGSLVRSAPQIAEDSHGWFFTMGCGGYDGYNCTLANAGGDFGELQITSAAFTLEDDDQPAVASASGSLLGQAASSGNLEFVATDATSGVYRAAIEVDGAEVVTSADSGDGRCERIGQAGALNDFVYRRPCPPRRQLELTIAPGSLRTGEHTLRARVYDAAGNGLTILTRRLNVTGGTLQSSSAARFVPDGSANMTANYGRWVRIAGTLEANTGEPIVNAPVELALTSRAATRGKILKTIHTNSDGRYSLSVRAGASRTLTLRHEESGAALTGSLKVKSRISLRAASRRVKSLGTMRLTGRIPGERAKRGASVAIKVRNGRRWRTVAVVRTDRGGAFKFSYRFRRTRHAALRFRAVALRSSDLVVAATPSMSLKVRVG